MALVPHKITALAESDAQGTSGKNIVAGAVVSLFDTSGAAVTLFDNEAGVNGSTTKQTDATGQVVVYVTPGEYDEEVNGSVKRRVQIGNKELTTVQLIDSARAYQVGDLITTTGFYSAGDGGAAKWRVTVTSGLSAPQYPSERGAAEIVIGNGQLLEFVGNALFVEQLGATLDGTTDETLIGEAAQAWCTSTGGNVYIGRGTLLTTGFLVNGQELKIFGLGEGQSEIKLKDNTTDHVIGILNGGKVTLKSLTINGNRLTQAGGHGIRSGGCNRLHINNVEIKDCYSYGIGFQAGANKDVKINTLTCHGMGQDGIDIKDYELSNDTIFISNFHAYNYGLLTDQQVGLDVRGPIVANNIVLQPSVGTNNYGFRVRPSSVQGRAGSGSVTNLTVIGDGVSTDHIALDIASNSGNINLTGINVKDFFLAMRLESATTGGNISSLVASGIYGTDCMSLSGDGWILSGIKVANNSMSSRVFDFEPGASNIRMTNVNLTDNSDSASSARIQAGASNIQLEGGFVKGGLIDDSGTDSIINVTYL